jgi:tRNA-intron endonuclease
MEVRRRDGEIVLGGHARQQFHDARGYGRPLQGNEIALTPVEAAHLLYRGDISTVEGMGFADFLNDVGTDGAAARFLVYADLRSRGFYLAPEREGWVSHPRENADFAVYERGVDPGDGAIAHHVRAIGERAAVPADTLGIVTLAIADEEGSVTYLATDRGGPEGATVCDPPQAEAVLLSDRVLVSDPPASLHESGFYGQPVGGREDATSLQLSLIEAASLARRDRLSVEGGAVAVEKRGRAVEGERFDSRLAVYERLREDGVVPKTGFKFGADFRTYAEVTSVSELGHSEALVWVLPAGYTFEPRELALYVRLAGGVRKRAMFALTEPDGTAKRDLAWLSVTRSTP